MSKCNQKDAAKRINLIQSKPEISPTFALFSSIHSPMFEGIRYAFYGKDNKTIKNTLRPSPNLRRSKSEIKERSRSISKLSSEHKEQNKRITDIIFILKRMDERLDRIESDINRINKRIKILEDVMQIPADNSIIPLSKKK